MKENQKGANHVIFKPLPTGVVLFAFACTIFSLETTTSILKISGGLTLALSLLLLGTVLLNWTIAALPEKWKVKLFLYKYKSSGEYWNKWMRSLSSPVFVLSYYCLFVASWVPALSGMTVTVRSIIIITGFIWLIVLLIDALRDALRALRNLIGAGGTKHN